ncbi:MAG: hypothetical protein GEV12_19840 [Micromonosporaceae bacterium]|nr:hypothetical protein [Micromonosporaceae bacterium]
MTRSPRALPAANAAALTVVAVGCGSTDEPDATVPSTGPAAVVSTPAGSPSLSPPVDPHENPQQQAVDAYVGMQRAYLKATETANPDHPDLATYAAGEALQRLRTGVASIRDQGLRGRGEATFQPAVESLNPVDAPTTITVRDCMDTNETELYDPSGEPYEDEPGGLQLVAATVEPVTCDIRPVPEIRTQLTIERRQRPRHRRTPTCEEQHRMTRRLSKTTRPAIVALAATALLLAGGCGQRASTGAGSPAATPSGSPLVVLPGSFPVMFPAPPDDAPVLSTEVVENAVLSNDLTTEHGTVLGTTVRYLYDGSDPSEVQRLLGHYREQLPAAGWTITAYEPPTEHEQPWRSQPGHRLRIDGHGYSNLTVTIEQDEDEAAVSLQVSVNEITLGRKPSEHPPLMALPDWYQHLPEPPAGERRYLIRITAAQGEPTVYYFDYEPDPQQPDDEEPGRAAVLAGHYQNTLPAAGWAIQDAQEHTDSAERDGGVVERLQLSVEFHGHQVTGTVHASESVSAAGQLLGSGVSVTVHPGGLPSAEPAPEPPS